MSHPTHALALTTTTRNRLIALVGALAILLPSVVVSVPAEAALPPATNVGGFEIDGNLLTDNDDPDTVPGTRDWDDAPTPKNDASVAGDDILTQGNNGGKEDSDPYVFATGNANAKDDLTKIYLDSRITGPTDAYIWAGFERLSGLGSAHVIFELNQAPVSQFHLRQTGDLRVSFEFGGQGSNESASAGVETWNGSAWVATTAAGTATVNSITNQPPLGTVTTPDDRLLLERQFGEVGVNLASYFSNASFRCANLSTVWARTRASASNTANVFDMAGPYAINIDLCSTIKAKKTDDSGNPMAGVEFTLYKDAATGTVGQLDANDTVVAAKDTGSDGIVTFTGVDTGTYFVRETEGSLTDYVLDTTVVGPIVVDYLDTISLWQDRDGDGPLTTGHTFVNARKTGTLEVVKSVSGGDGSDLFNLFVKQGATTEASATDVGHDGTTGPTTLPTGTYTVSETAGTGTTLDDYVASVSCTDANDVVVASNAGGANVDVAVGHNDDITCTITNTRKTGAIELKKDLSPNEDLGTFDLYIKDATGTTTVDSASNVGDGGTTGQNVVDTGTYQLSEVGNSADLDDYVPTIACVNEADATDTVTASPDGGAWTVAVGHGDDIVCEITNVRKTGQLTIQKVLSPSDDAGTFDLLLGTTVKADDIGNGGSSGAMVLPTGTYTVSEVAAGTTDLADYTASITCTGDAPVSATTTSVDVGYGDDITCTITNTRKTGQLTIDKVVVGDVPASDTFALQLDGTTEATGGHGTTTNAMTLNTGTYTVAEIAAGTTDLADYTASITCTGDAPVSATTTSVDVGYGDDITCTITNTRKTGQLTIDKVVVGDVPASDTFALQLDGTTEATGGHGTTTNAMTLNTGTYTVAEIAAGTTDLADYTASITCTGDAPVSATTTSVDVGYGDDITCTITNTRKTGTIELKKDLAPDEDPGKFDLLIEDADGTDVASVTGVGDGGTTGETTVNTGVYTLSELAAAGTDLSDYTPALSCVLDGTQVAVPTSGSGPWTVSVGNNQNIDCTIVNARQTGTLTVLKSLSPTGDPGLFDLSIDDVVLATDVAHGEGTGPTTVNTGTHTVAESAGTDTTLDDYVSSVVCVKATEQGDVPVAMTEPEGPNTSLAVSIGYGDVVTCTIFNTRKTGNLTILKDIQPDTDGGTFDLTLDGQIVASGVGDGQGTQAMELDTGSYLVGETAAPGSVLSDYVSAVRCVDGENELASAESTAVSVDVGHDADVVCTITNVRIPHDLTLVKTDADTEAPLQGVGFTLYSSDGDAEFEPGTDDLVVGAEQTTDATGTTTWADLQPGSYWLAETDAPAGHFQVAPRLVSIDDEDVTVSLGNVPHHPAIALTKSVEPGVVNVGGDATYTYAIENTGDIVLTDVTLVDDVLGTILGDENDSVISLDPDEKLTVTVTQTFTELDLPGPIVNVADATGTAPDGTVVSDQDTASVTLTSNPSIEIVKTSDPGDSAQIGDVVTYTYVVTNTGDVTLTGVVASDDLLGTITLTTTTLAPGESTQGALTHTVVEADLPGPIVNVATATGTPPVGDDVSDTDDESVDLTTNPDIEVVKTSDVESAAPGDQVTYTYVLTNTGDVTLTNVTLVDDILGTILGDENDTVVSLAPGASLTLTVVQTITEGDLPGPLVNTAITTGTPPVGPDVSDEAVESVDLTSDPSIEVVKTPSATGASIGDIITYTYVVTNTGDVTLINVTATDDLLGPITLTTTTLAPGESTQGTLAHTVADADMPGPIVNVATATGTPPVGPDVSDDDDAQVSLLGNPAIDVVKTAEVEPDIEGFKTVSFEPDDGDDETIDYSYVVTNTGDVTLTNITLVDDVLGTITLADTTLGPGESTTGTASHVITQADADAFEVFNVADVSGTGPDGTVVEDQDDELVFIEVVLPFVFERPPDPTPDPIAPIELPRTGSESRTAAIFAAGLLVLGVLTLLEAERRVRRQTA